MSAKVEVAIGVRPKQPPYVEHSKPSMWVSVLEVTHELPEVCARHGKPAVECIDHKVRGDASARESQAQQEQLSMLRLASNTTRVKFDLHGRWPWCRTCLVQRSVGNFALGFAGLAALALLVFVLFSLRHGLLNSPIFGGPIDPPGILLVCGLVGLAGYILRLAWKQPAEVTINSESMVAIRAHQRFAECMPVVSPLPVQQFGTSLHHSRWMLSLGPQQATVPLAFQDPAGLIPVTALPDEAAYPQQQGPVSHGQVPGPPPYSGQPGWAPHPQPAGPAPYPHPSGMAPAPGTQTPWPAQYSQQPTSYGYVQPAEYSQWANPASHQHHPRDSAAPDQPSEIPPL